MTAPRSDGRGLSGRWWTVAGSAMAQTVGMGPLLQFTFSVFLLPIAAEFGADRGQVSIALTSALLATAVTVPFAGRLIDRFDTRRLIGSALVLLAAGLILLSLAAHSLLVFTLIFTVIGAIAAFQSPLAYSRLVSLRFDRDRGLALALMLTGVGLGTIVVPQIANWLIASSGWRGAYAGLAGLLLALAVPGLWIATYCPPEIDRSSRIPRAGLSMAEALRTGRLWRILAGTFLAGIAVNGTIAHLVPMATDAGYTRDFGVRLLSIAGIASIAGRIIAGRLADRVGAGMVAAGFFATGAVGVVGLAIGFHDPRVWWIEASLVGLGLGAEADLIGLVVGRYFGLRSFGQLFGLVFATFILASSIGPLSMGLTFTWFGSYRPELLLLAFCLIVAGALFISLGQYLFAESPDGAAGGPDPRPH